MGDDTMMDDDDKAEVGKLVAEVCAAIIPEVVSEMLAGEMQGVMQEMEGLKLAMYAAETEGLFDELNAVVVKSYALHMARVAAISGVKVGEFARIARDVATETATEEGLNG